jgi:hypothetical protein
VAIERGCYSSHDKKSKTKIFILGCLVVDILTQTSGIRRIIDSNHENQLMKQSKLFKTDLLVFEQRYRNLVAAPENL